MKVKNYKKLCKFCDKVLLSKKSTIYTHAVTDLHILKEHPVILDKYFNISNYSNKDTSSLNFKILKYLKDLFFENKNFKLSNFQKNGCDVIIISNLINEKHLSDSKDFYFGNLEKKLNNEGLKTFTVLRNFTEIKYLKLKLKLSKNKIILFKTTHIVNEIFFLIKAVTEFFKIKKKINKLKILNLKSSFLNLLSFRSVLSNLRLSSQVKELIKITKPSLLIITFEGHAWERVLIKTIRSLNPSIKIAAYQLTSMTRFQHSIFRKLRKDYNPDLILTTGEVTKKKFIREYNSETKIIGSNKSTRSNDEFRLNKINSDKKINFLFLPEGFYSETLFLYNFAVKCAIMYPNFNFTFKYHPMINKSLKKKNLNNFCISRKNLKYELKKNHFTIFRGSAAVYEAILNGSVPIYLSISNEMSINPLSDIFPKNRC